MIFTPKCSSLRDVSNGTRIIKIRPFFHGEKNTKVPNNKLQPTSETNVNFKTPYLSLRKYAKVIPKKLKTPK